ncbi:MAG: metallophosphatase family protein [Fimbriiglobus sp.]|jgi:putative phosphoesterase|nr:metallophosphatase family protein [Fimbriiglobus sp.]
MRILVVADIHANRPALDAIREPFDVCLCLGDIVEYGPYPTECIDWVRTSASHCVRGNHDHGAVQNVPVVGTTGFRYLTMVSRKVTAPALSLADRRFLADLPTTALLTLGGKRFFLVHASPRDPLEEYVPADPNEWATRVAGVKADFVLVGHTHQQFEFRLKHTTVVNPGSVGLPRDGDPRARYAIIDDGRVELKAVEYAVETTIAAVESSELEPTARRQLAEVYRLGKYQFASPSGNGAYTNGVHHPGREQVGA